MGELVITVGVDKSAPGGVEDLQETIARILDLQVMHEPGCCPPCRVHTAVPPYPPFADCRGEEPHAKAAGYGCRCKVVLKHSD